MDSFEHDNVSDKVDCAQRSDAEAIIDNPLPDQSTDVHPQSVEDAGEATTLGVGEVVMPDEEAGKEAEIGDHPGWNNTVSLYCPKNGRSHQVLLDFGQDSCPKCGVDLTQKPLVSDDTDSTSESGTSTSEDTDEDTDEGPAEDQISFAIKYMDREDNSITTEPWDGPFDLATVRDGIETTARRPIEVVTVLKTTVPGESYRMRSEIRKLMEKGILRNPAIGVSVESVKMVIHSQSIIQAIKTVVPYYPSVNMDAHTIDLEEPFPLIGHYISELEEYLSSLKKITVNQVSSPAGNDASADSVVATASADGGCTHLGLLLDLVRNHTYKDDIGQEKKRHAVGSCTFRMLWLLFKPGSTVYCEAYGKLAAYVVQDVTMDPVILSTSSNKSPYVINMWNLDFDGKFVGRCQKTVTISEFQGEREITTLKVFPCSFVDDKDGRKLRTTLETQGKRWYELLAGGQVHYSGRLLDSSQKDCHGRVYVDSVSYYSDNEYDAPDVGDVEDMGEGLAKCSCEECKGRRTHPPAGFRWSQYDVLDPLKDRNLELNGSIESAEHRYLLCSRRLYGLVLKTRDWEMLDVANCKAPKINEQAIKSLVMPDERKTLIEALVQKYTGSRTVDGALRPWRADYMENKGEGQIFLLHGGPGVGKTFTAECIAEYTGRALLSLTVGDIGADEGRLEANLNKWFSLAETWGAVILIDEADVYLERRSINDLKRNALVSVFLRCIEYYRGILFLTTNRVGTFDDAFMSRIHVVIAYDNLGPSERAIIWKQFFQKLSEDRQDIRITKRAKDWVLKDDAMVKFEWNGREIRNAFQTAVALADYRCQRENEKRGTSDQPVLDQGDFEQVLEMASQFKKYLSEVHGVDEDRRAYLWRNRAFPELVRRNTEPSFGDQINMPGR